MVYLHASRDAPPSPAPTTSYAKLNLPSTKSHISRGDESRPDAGSCRAGRSYFLPPIYVGNVVGVGRRPREGGVALREAQRFAYFRGGCRSHPVLHSK